MQIVHAIDHAFNFLGYTFPNNQAVDLIRIAFIVFAALTALLSFRIAYERKFFVFWGAGALLVGAVCVELQQLGHRFVPWRLPIFWTGVILTWLAVRKVIREW